MRAPLVLAGLTVVALSALALCVGRFPIAPADLAATLWGLASGDPAIRATPQATVLLELRGPRVLAALLVGAGLAASGAALQGMFRNPLVSPDILGASAGAALGAVLGLFFSLGVLAVQMLAFAGGLGAVALVYATSAGLRAHDPVLVPVLIGLVIGALLGAGIGLVKYLADPYNQLPAMTFWLLGSLAATNRADLAVLAPPVLAGLAGLMILRWRMNALTLDEDEARALGLPTGLLRVGIVVAATLATSAGVAVAGVIGWVGLIVPHVARLIVGPDFGRLVPMTLLIGAGYLVAVDTLARTLAAIEIPLGILTAVIGSPVFVWLLATLRRGWQ